MTISKRTFCAAAALMLLPACASDPLADFDNSAALANPDKYFAFVGEQIDVVQFDPVRENPDNPDEIVIVLDAAFMTRYRVLQVVHGDHDAPTVDFVAFDHYGYPKFAKQKYALIYLRDYDGALFHVKYTYDTVYPTADGRFAGCGDPYGEIEDGSFVPRALEDIDYATPVVLRISDRLIAKSRRKDYDPAAIAENEAQAARFFSSPAFSVRGDAATCKMGVYAEELFRIRWETEILPRARREYCEARYELRDAWRDPEQKNLLDACVAEAKANGMPF